MTKEDAVADAGERMAAEFAKMVGCVEPALVGILNTLADVKRSTDNTTEQHVLHKQSELHRLLRLCTDPQLEAIIALSGGGMNKSAKLSAASKQIFAEHHRALKKLATSIDTVSTALQVGLEHCLLKVLGSDGGEIVWSKMQGEILHETRRRAAPAADAPM